MTLLSILSIVNLFFVLSIKTVFSRDFLVERQLGPDTLLLRYSLGIAASHDTIHASGENHFGAQFAGLHCLGKGSTTVFLDVPNHPIPASTTPHQSNALSQDTALLHDYPVTHCLKVSDAFAKRMGDLFSDHMPYFYSRKNFGGSSYLIWLLEDPDLALLQDEKHDLYAGSALFISKHGFQLVKKLNLLYTEEDGGSVGVQVGGSILTMALTNAALTWLKVLLFEKRLRLLVQIGGHSGVPALAMQKKYGQTRLFWGGREVAMLGLETNDKLIIYTTDTRHKSSGLNTQHDQDGLFIGVPVGSKLKKETIRDEGIIRAVQGIVAPHFPWFFHLSPPPKRHHASQSNQLSPNHASQSHQLLPNQAFQALRADDPLLYWRHVEKSVQGELWQLAFRAVPSQATHDEDGRLLVDSHINMYACPSAAKGVSGAGDQCSCDGGQGNMGGQPLHTFEIVLNRNPMVAYTIVGDKNLALLVDAFTNSAVLEVPERPDNLKDVSKSKVEAEMAGSHLKESPLTRHALIHMPLRRVFHPFFLSDALGDINLKYGTPSLCHFWFSAWRAKCPGSHSPVYQYNHHGAYLLNGGGHVSPWLNSPPDLAFQIGLMTFAIPITISIPPVSYTATSTQAATTTTTTNYSTTTTPTILQVQLIFRMREPKSIPSVVVAYHEKSIPVRFMYGTFPDRLLLQLPQGKLEARLPKGALSLLLFLAPKYNLPNFQVEP